jgi:lipoate-protein ligase A
MAVDEVLLEWAAETGGCCWRFYRWEEPTLSLGYFQTYDDRWQHAASRKCPVVRRASGGGAILHDLELTYSCVWPQGHRLAAGRLQLYEAVHASLVELLASYGVRASLCDPASGQLATPPFLCFQRRSPGDLLVGPIKVAGSAQRRLRGAVLQHGSILLARSLAAPELDGLLEVAGLSLDAASLSHVWLERLGSRLGLAWQAEPLSNSECHRATALADTKYGAETWTKNRGR